MNPGQKSDDATHGSAAATTTAGTPAAAAQEEARSSAHPVADVKAAAPTHSAAAPAAASSWKKKVILAGAGVAVLAAIGYFGIPWVMLIWRTVSTDDAYVNGHFTLVAAARRRAGEESLGG